MKNIRLFKCIGNENDEIPNILLNVLGFHYEEANNDTMKMASLSKAIKEYNNVNYCTLPFCHTIEAESFGSYIVIDNKIGNHIVKYVINEKDEFDKITKMDLNNGRIQKVFEAISLLKNEGEKVCLNITGPISLATSIMDSQLFYRSIRKEEDSIIKLMEIIEDSIIEFILKGVSLGVDIISYADPTGTIDIVGPKFYQDISGKSTYKILKRIESKLGHTIVHICTKTSKSLEAIGLLESEQIKVQGSNYGTMIDKVIKNRKDIKFIGHWCMKRHNDVINNGNITKCVIL